MQTQVLHYPRLDTVMMIEDAIRKAREYQTKKELWESLPRKVMYQTFNLVLDYLEKSNKILIDKRDRKIVWIAADNKELNKLLRNSVRVK